MGYIIYVLIKKVALDFILGVSSELYPREFGGLIRVEDGVITESLVLPDSIWGEGFAQINPFMMPVDDTVGGSVHSHPGPSFQPSTQDLLHFSKTGETHLIAKYPYRDLNDIACYNRSGERISLEVIDDDD